MELGGRLEIPLNPLTKVNVEGYAGAAAHVLEEVLQPTNATTKPSLLSTTSSTYYLIHTTLDFYSPTLDFVQPSQLVPIDPIAYATIEAPQPIEPSTTTIVSPQREAHITKEDPIQKEAPAHEEVRV